MSSFLGLGLLPVQAFQNKTLTDFVIGRNIMNEKEKILYMKMHLNQSDFRC